MASSFMNSGSRITSLLLLSLAAQIALAQTSTAPPTRDSNELSDRDLRIRQLPPPPDQMQVVPHGYALIVGVGKYEKLDPDEFLKFSESDAEAVYRVLISQQGGSFPAENVHKLIGSQATLYNLRHELEEWLPSVANEQDRVIVYFAGHGFVKEGRGYIAPWDVDPSSPETTAYPMNLLGAVLAGKVKARWKVLLTDACHSGKITPESTNEAVDEQFRELPGGFLTLTATREREKSYEDPNLSTGFGIFSYFLVQGLQGNADNNPCDGVITADELIEYVRSEVRSYTRARGVSQTPTDHSDFDNNMVLAVNKGCANTSLPPPASSGSIVIEANMDGVDVYLDDRLVGTVANGKPFPLPGLATGIHIVKGVKIGYEPDTKEVMVVPGQERSVTLRIQYRREYKRSSIDLVDRGEALLFKSTSSFNPLAPYAPSRQTETDLKKARDLFTKALKEDPSYAKATFDLAMACQLLSDETAMLAAFRQAIQMEPGYTEARVQFAGALIEKGDPDEAIRQLTEALRLEPKNDVAYSHLARAYLDKGIWGRAIESADQALFLKPRSEQAYLWKADALRRQAAEAVDRARRPAIYVEALESYRSYLDLTNFNSPIGEKLAYYFIGLGLGSRGHADRQIVYAYQRSLAFMGLCDCEAKLGNLQRATDYCQRAIKYDPEEPLARFLLGNVYRDLFNRTKAREYLISARSNYARMVQINPDLELSRNARDYVAQIDRLLPLVK
jgi:tetratricopeptide (TPR) repeat protein